MGRGCSYSNFCSLVHNPQPQNLKVPYFLGVGGWGRRLVFQLLFLSPKLEKSQSAIFLVGVEDGGGGGGFGVLDV